MNLLMMRYRFSPPLSSKTGAGRGLRDIVPLQSLTDFKMKKHEETKYRRDFIAQLPCLACASKGIQTHGVQCAHVRYSQGGSVAGWGMKPPHDRIVPLCPNHHTLGPDAQHNHGEREWWEKLGVDPIEIGSMLSEVYHKYDGLQAIDVGEKIIWSVDQNEF